MKFEIFPENTLVYKSSFFQNDNILLFNINDIYSFINIGSNKNENIILENLEKNEDFTINSQLNKNNIKRIVIIDRIEIIFFILEQLEINFKNLDFKNINLIIIDITDSPENSDLRLWTISKLNKNYNFKNIEIKYCSFLKHISYYLSKKKDKQIIYNNNIEKDRNLCVLCHSNNPKYGSLPCKHLLYCEECIYADFSILTNCAICKQTCYYYFNIF